MDRGAHFHRCDLQVHSPRDRQWAGLGAVTDGDRRAYAQEFVANCREKGLDAVAITDHHDIAFVPYIRAAAAAETDEFGTLFAPERRLTAFPGIELTLGVPCQALLIFDADFPDDLFSLALTALAITPSASADARTAETVRLNHITSLEQLYEKLDEHAYLRGRYIVLPNVSEGGTSTLLRAGHAAHYQDMPCVGGYLDGDVTQLGNGNQRILGGLDPQYGSKPLGLFQTSDCRQRDLALLGRSSTWVKWAEPTAEALRQASLARQTRLSQTEPLIPDTAITALNVSNSTFMGPVYLELNPQYNALIGGRGTGKSTILEYMRWALCDQPPRVTEDDDLGDEQTRRRKLVEQTLVPVKGVVDVHFIVNGAPHVVRRSSGTGELFLRIAGGAFESCKESEVRGLLPIQAYSQKQLSGVGVRLDELRRFIHAPVRKELEDTEAALATVVAEVRRTYFLAHTKRSQQRELENEERELRSLTEQTTAIRNSLAGIDAADRVILEAHAAHEREAEIVNGWRDDLARAEAGLEDLLHTLRTLPSNAAPEDLKGLPQSTLLEAMRSSLVSPIRNAENAIESQLQALRELGLTGSYAIASEEWSKQNEEYQGAYAAAKARSTSHETRLAELDDLENRSKAIRLRLTAKRGEIADFGEPEEELRAAREQWSALHERRSDLLAAQCNRLTELSGGQIRATLLRGRVVDRVAERLKAALAGTGIRTNKIDELCQAWTAAESPVRQAQQVMTELELLGQLDASTATEAQLPQTPLLAASFGPKDLLKIATKISPEAWVDVSTSQLEDQPRFEYRLREQDYIAFADASAGQQATSLLWALLNQDGPPLLIDQPEDDLDNQVVLEIVEQIWQAKRKRQLIFASHNANLVVNGDADLVASCGYRVAGEQAGGVIKIQGAIDVAQVRSEIAAVMEGGKAAFTLRKEKYGF